MELMLNKGLDFGQGRGEREVTGRGVVSSMGQSGTVSLRR
jgi:hypothetical protein